MAIATQFVGKLGGVTPVQVPGSYGPYEKITTVTVSAPSLLAAYTSTDTPTDVAGGQISAFQWVPPGGNFGTKKHGSTAIAAAGTWDLWAQDYGDPRKDVQYTVIPL